jgi:hypothetical protein
MEKPRKNQQGAETGAAGKHREQDFAEREAALL